MTRRIDVAVSKESQARDYSDVKVIDAEGREIPWNQVSRIDQDEMKLLIAGVVNRIHSWPGLYFTRLKTSSLIGRWTGQPHLGPKPEMNRNICRTF